MYIGTLVLTALNTAGPTPFDVMGINVDPAYIPNPIIYRSPPVVSEKHTRPAPSASYLYILYTQYSRAFKAE